MSKIKVNKRTEYYDLTEKKYVTRTEAVEVDSLNPTENPEAETAVAKVQGDSLSLTMRASQGLETSSNPFVAAIQNYLRNQL